jgi:lysozyme
MSNWKWCVQGPDGKPVKGWYEDNNTWYYLNDEGIMQTGWIRDTDEKWYYLEPLSNGNMGAMYCDGTYIIDGKSYSFDSSGAWIENDVLVSDALINFIKSWEGFPKEGRKYYDEVGVLTQGYGMTGDEIKKLPDQITEEQATSMLKDLIDNKYAPVIKADLDSRGIVLNQNEFDALVSFAYNCGIDGLINQSTLYKNVIAGVRNSATITSNFQAWSNGGGRRIEGLYRRRTKEAKMFLNADYTGNV